MRLRSLSRRYLVLASVSVTVLCLAASAWAAEIVPGKVTKARFALGDRTVTYYLFVPKGVTEPASAPMLVLLHGSNRDGSTLVEPWKKLADKEGIVLLGPDAQNRAGWEVPADGPPALCALVDDVRKALPVVDSRRIYLFGHSAGAVFALYIAALQSEYFAAAGLHAGAWRAPEELGYAAWAARPIPMALTVGDSDRFFSVEAVQATAEAFRRARVPVEVEVIPNHDHNYYVRSGKVNEWVWERLKRHALTGDPKFTQHEYR